jgi:signal transduction histidine kinase
LTSLSGRSPTELPATPPRHDQPTELRRRIDRLGGLPLRAETVRCHLEPLLDRDEPAPDGNPDMPAPRAERVAETDPGWVLARLCPTFDPLRLIAERPWWRATGSAADAVTVLWRHAVATCCAARRLASESGELDPDRAAGLGLLHGLGLWALAAVDPQNLAAMLAIDDLAERRARERTLLGCGAPELGRRLAERFGCDPLLADVAWLHADFGSDLHGLSTEPDGLRLIQKAFAWAERTPWALRAAPGVVAPGDPRARLLTAEVQVRCANGCCAADASESEERVARAHARLLGRTAALHVAADAHRRLIDALASSDPTETPAAWADRTARVWCGELGVAAARVVWHGDGPRASALAASSNERAIVVPLGPPARPWAELELRPEAAAAGVSPNPSMLAAWSAWAGWVAAVDRGDRRLDVTVDLHRAERERADRGRSQDLLTALGEFAGGAGHELNNPLAVIVGRAQLLLGRAQDSESARSLRAIITQARRVHRILRDLMYVARPPAPRPRLCQPDEILRACVNDLQLDADARGIRLSAELPGRRLAVAVDPDGLRHIAEVLTRNALEATPAGGAVRVSSALDPHRLEWSVRDSGKGLDISEGRHLFDPFFCGRQAGRGLGLGLPRAARFVELAGGEVRWRSNPGQGTTFTVTLPVIAEPVREDQP